VPIVTTVRRLLRRLLLWLATALDDAGTAAAPVQSGGPPADWVARVRRGAPQLLEEPERGGVPRNEVPGGERARGPRRPADVVPFAPAPHRPSSAEEPARRRTRAVIEEALVARKVRPAADGNGGAPRFRPLADEQETERPSSASGETGTRKPAAPRLQAPLVIDAPLPARRDEHRDPEPAWPARHELAEPEAEPPARRWPELPARPPQALPRPEDVPAHGVAAAHPRGEAGSDARPIREGARDDEPPPMPDLPWPRLEEASALDERRTHYEELSRQERFARVAESASPEPDHRWPELPPLPPFAHELLAPIESLDEPDRRRRVDEEQRRSGWSE
jgi:hypothetical protein